MREVLGPNATLTGEGKILPVVLAIGPEGGWTEAEISAATAAGFSEISLGAAILRTETAVCAALAAVQYALGELRTPMKKAAS
jgi:16S rRNA (uracil1498-N3)-methyltransferase